MEYKKLADVCILNRFQELDAATLSELNVGYGNIKLLPSSKDFDWFSTEDICKNYICEGEVITLGRARYANIKYWSGKFVAANNVVIETFNPEKLVCKYLYYFLLFNVKRFYVEGTTYPKFDNNIFKSTYIPIPSLEKQRQIVNQLNFLCSSISKVNEEINNLSKIVKSRFIELFGRINNTEYKVFTIADLCEFVKDGTHQTPTYTDDTINGYKFLSSKDVTSGKIDWSNNKYIPEELHEKLYKTIKPQRNDILLAKNGTTGIAALVETDDIFDIYVSLAILRFKQNNNPKYMLYAINNDDTKEQFDESLKGVGVPNLHLGEIKKTKIIVPPIELQNEFASFVQLIDKSKFILEKQKKNLEELYESKLHEYFGD